MSVSPIVVAILDTLGSEPSTAQKRYRPTIGRCVVAPPAIHPQSDETALIPDSGI